MPPKGFRKILCKRGHTLSEDNRIVDGSCKTCERQRVSDWAASHPEEYKASKQKWADANRVSINEASRQYRAENPDVVKFIRIKQRYGITKEQYDAMMAEQNGGCAICLIKFDHVIRPEVDHKHDGTKNARGLLCHQCNVLLGAAKDDTDVLRWAVEYLIERR